MFISSGRHLPIIAAVMLTAAPTAAREVRHSRLGITNAWSRATAPRAPVGAGFVTIRNNGDRPDRLVAAASPRAAKVEIHTMSVAGGIMRMRPLPDGLSVGPGKEIRLAPGGNHLMLIGLRQPLRQGETVPVTLQFERAGRIEVRLLVQGPGAESPAHDMGKHQ